MKKNLVILLTFLVLTNFHCVRFNLQTVDAGNILASCRATLLDVSGDTLIKMNGTLILTESSLLFKHKGDTREIPYSQISSLDTQGNIERVFPKPAPPSFTKKNKLPGIAIGLGAVIIIMMVVLIYFSFTEAYSCARISNPTVEIYADTASGIDLTTFLMTRGDLDKIYPLLVEKVH